MVFVKLLGKGLCEASMKHSKKELHKPLYLRQQIAKGICSSWSFIEKTSVKQDPKPQVCSHFQMSFLHLSQMDPLVEASGVQDQY